MKAKSFYCKVILCISKNLVFIFKRLYYKNEYMNYLSHIFIN